MKKYSLKDIVCGTLFSGLALLGCGNNRLDKRLYSCQEIGSIISGKRIELKAQGYKEVKVTSGHADLDLEKELAIIGTGKCEGEYEYGKMYICDRKQNGKYSIEEIDFKMLRKSN